MFKKFIYTIAYWFICYGLFWLLAEFHVFILESETALHNKIFMAGGWVIMNALVAVSVILVPWKIWEKKNGKEEEDRIQKNG